MTTPERRLLGGLTRIREFAGPDFRRYLAATTVSSTGSALTGVALPLVVFGETHSALLASLVVAVQVGPFLAFGLVAGAVADRARRRRLMIACDLVSGLALVGLVICAALGVSIVPAAMTAAVVVQVAFVFFGAADFAAIPALVGRNRVVEAQSALSSITIMVGLVVPAVAAALYGTIGPLPLFAIDAATFFFSAVMLTRVRSQFLSTSGDGRTPRRGLPAEIADGLRYLWREKVVRALTLIGACNAIGGGVIDAMLVVFASRALGIVPEDPRISMFFLAGSIGSLSGALALPHLRRRLPVLTVTRVLLVCSGGAVALIAAAPVAAVAIVAFAVWRATYGMTITNGITLRMQVLPDDYQSRVGSAARLIALSGSPVGALLAGVLAGGTSIRVVIALAAVPILAGIALASHFHQSLGSVPEAAPS